MAGSNRIQYIRDRDDIPAADRHHFDSIEQSRGGVRGPFSVLLNSPELGGRVGHLGAYVRYESSLADPIRELAIITTAREFDCAYEWAAHVPIARDVGVSESTIDVVAQSAPTTNLAAPESIVIDYSRELFRDHAVSTDTFERALDYFGEGGITDLTGTIGYYAMIACALNAFEVVPDSDRPSLP